MKFYKNATFCIFKSVGTIFIRSLRLLSLFLANNLRKFHFLKFSFENLGFFLPNSASGVGSGPGKARKSVLRVAVSTWLP